MAAASAATRRRHRVTAMQLLLLLAAATALVSVVAQEEQADPWTATGLAAIEHLPRSHEAQEHMRRRVNQLKEEAETAEAAHRRRRMQSADGPVVEHTLALLKPDFVQKGDMAIARMLTRLRHEGFAVVRQRKLEPALKAEVAAELYREHQERSFFPKLMDYMASGPAFAIELQAVDAVQKWRDLIGPTDPAVAKVEAPDSLRAKHGKDKTFNGFHGSESVDAAHREIRLVFEN